MPELSEPCCSVLAHSVDCRNEPLPPYAGNLVFMLPVKHEMPCHYAVRIKLCKGVDPRDWQGTLNASKYVFINQRSWYLKKTDQYVVKLSKEPAFLWKWRSAIIAAQSLPGGELGAMWEKGRSWLLSSSLEHLGQTTKSLVPLRSSLGLTTKLPYSGMASRKKVL